jgi:hypothetical protein
MVGFSPLLLWACGEAVHHGGEYMAEETAYLMAARMQKETEKEAEDKI